MDSRMDTGGFLRWVSPFRHLRIFAYLQLPAAFRSLSRLSSAPSAKASALCPSLLNPSLFPPSVAVLGCFPDFSGLLLGPHVSMLPCFWHAFTCLAFGTLLHVSVLHVPLGCLVYLVFDLIFKIFFSVFGFQGASGSLSVPFFGWLFISHQKIGCFPYPCALIAGKSLPFKAFLK